MSSKLERRHLEALVALAEQPAFSKAAQRLLIAPSALASAIRQVERMVGEPIVRRSPTGMSLTTRGKEIANAARDALQSMQSVLAGTSGAPDIRGGILVVHTTPTLAETFGAKVVNSLRARFPALRIVVHAPPRSDIANIEYAVASGEADFAMTQPVARRVPELRYSPLARQDMAYVFPANAEHHPEHATLEDLRRYGLLVIPEFESSQVYRALRSRAPDLDAWFVARVAHRHAFVDLAAGGVAGYMCDYEARAEAVALGLHVAPFVEPVIRQFATVTRVDDERTVIQAALAETELVRRAQSGQAHMDERPHKPK